MPADSQLPYVIIGVVAFFLLVSIRRRREAIRHALRRAIVVEAVGFGVFLIVMQVGGTPLNAGLCAVVAALIVASRIRGRSRHIPASERRLAKEEHKRLTGKNFRPGKDELDHEVPYANGGSHTADNLRVVEKRKNRSKGAKSPWWDLLGR
jgi:hypothetical protein